MTITYSFGIYRKGTLIKSFLVNVDEDSIDQFEADQRAANPDCVVECQEHEEYRGENDDFECLEHA